MQYATHRAHAPCNAPRNAPGVAPEAGSRLDTCTIHAQESQGDSGDDEAARGDPAAATAAAALEAREDERLAAQFQEDMKGMRAQRQAATAVQAATRGKNVRFAASPAGIAAASAAAAAAEDEKAALRAKRIAADSAFFNSA